MPADIPIRMQKESALLFSSPLRRAIARGLKKNGNLYGELSKLRDYPIRTSRDAKTICKALKLFPSRPKPERNAIRSELYSLTTLFHQVDGSDCRAFDILYHDGQLELLRIIEELSSQPPASFEDDLLMILKVFAVYGSKEGASKIIQVIKLGLFPNAFMWHSILRDFAQHPQQEFVFSSLARSLPRGFVAIGLLDCANRAAIEYGMKEHPFDNPEGYTRLKNWLTDPNPDHFSYAISSSAALPSVTNSSEQDLLLSLSMSHSDPKVRIEGAWAATKAGKPGGLELMQQYCLDINHSVLAQRYLTELGLQDSIPEQVHESSFQAKAELANWLTHPSELGKPADELEIIDHRELAWPPEFEKRPMWIIKFLSRDKTGLEDDICDCGLVGSMTWSFFFYSMIQRPPEDVYAIHCYWELQQNNLIEELEVKDHSEYEVMLRQWQGAALQSPRIFKIAELSNKLRASSNIVGIARASIDGERGCVVLDGKRSEWYPVSEFPKNGNDTILRIHVGRNLLGLTDPADRKEFLQNQPPSRSPSEIVTAYETLLNESLQASGDALKELVGNRCLLGRAFSKYLDARTAIDSVSRDQLFIDIYPKVLAHCRNSDKSIHEEIFDSFGFLGTHFSEYVEVLVRNDKANEVVTLVEFFKAWWQHNFGYGQLGSALFRSGHRDFAEAFLQKLIDGLEDSCCSEEMCMLARLWFERGETAKAKDLLLTCLKGIVNLIAESEYPSDCENYATKYKLHYQTILELFPQCQPELQELGLRPDPLES